MVGIARISKAAYPDLEQFDEDNSQATREEPRWVVVDVEFVAGFDEILSLEQLKADAKHDGLLVTRKGQRLTIQPVDANTGGGLQAGGLPRGLIFSLTGRAQQATSSKSTSKD